MALTERKGRQNTMKIKKLTLTTLVVIGLLSVFLMAGALPAHAQVTAPVASAQSAFGQDAERIAIPAIGVDTVIVNTPRSGNSWDTTQLTWQVGHMEGTATPGQGSNVVLVSHRFLGISNGRPTNPGPFAAMDSLRSGDQIQVTYGGQLYTYSVTEQFQITRRDTWVIGSSNSEIVTLMSCDGWNPATQTYDLLLAVRGTLVNVQPLNAAVAAPAPPQPQAQAQPAAPAATSVTANTTATLRVRAEPSTTAATLGLAARGTSMKVIGRNSASSWILVEIGGTRGWVAAWFATVNGDLNSVPVVTS